MSVLLFPFYPSSSTEYNKKKIKRETFLQPTIFLSTSIRPGQNKRRTFIAYDKSQVEVVWDGSRPKWRQGRENCMLTGASLVCPPPLHWKLNRAREVGSGGRGTLYIYIYMRPCRNVACLTQEASELKNQDTLPVI
jgi:hypothetical protein